MGQTRTVRLPLRWRIGNKLVEWAIRLRRKPEAHVYCESKHGLLRRHDWQSPTRGFLVYAGCRCGWWCAGAESGLWPHCPNCGARVQPPRGEPGNPNFRMGFAAEFLPEPEAAERVNKRSLLA